MNTYVASDWHGCLWVWEQVKKILKQNDTLFYLGDSTDRGPDGWQLFKELIDDPRIIYLKGNHDNFLYQNLKDANSNEKIYSKELHMWYYNGGYVTHNAFNNDLLPIAQKMKYIYQISKMPLYIIFSNKYDDKILLSHAGCDNFDDINRTDEEHWLWDRTHWLVGESWHGKDNEYIIHGHTPIQLMIQEQQDVIETFNDANENIQIPIYNGHGTYWYAKGHKACIDTGTVWTNEAVLLNLDTWEEIILTK